jgi:hypothetical protein
LVEAAPLFQATSHISENVAGHSGEKLMQVNCKNMSIDKALRLLTKESRSRWSDARAKERESTMKSQARNVTDLKQAAIRRNKKK